jgi:OmpA-OmpF porin, OOP family
MTKLLFAMALALSIPATCAAASTDTSASDTTGTDQFDNFYVAGNLGQTQYRANVSHPDSVFQNVRFGWRWNGLIGAEVGYVYLGTRKDSIDNALRDYETSVNARAATLGVNGKYNVYQGWFVTAHAGYLRSERKQADTYYYENSSFRQTSWNNGWYGGIGAGYDVTRNVSLALNYDNYHLQYNHPDESFRDKVNAAAYSASIEYRF